MSKSKLKQKAKLLFASSLMLGALSQVSLAQTSQVSDTETQRAMVAATKQLVVYEGLPKFQTERSSLEQELARLDVIIFNAQAFYSPGRAATNDSVLKEVITSPGSINTYSGAKRTTFHPDYAVTWKESGTTQYIFVSLGSGEIIFYGPKDSHKYDLSRDALKKLKVALAPYAQKRPPQ